MVTKKKRPGAKNGMIGIGPSNGQNIQMRVTHPEFRWIRAEAARRHVSSAQVARDAFRAYRKLVKDATKVEQEQTDSIPVDF